MRKKCLEVERAQKEEKECASEDVEDQKGTKEEKGMCPGKDGRSKEHKRKECGFRNMYDGLKNKLKINTEDIKKYCLSKHKSYVDHPFGDIPICCKLNGKIFAQIYPKPEDFKITLKCTAEYGEFFRRVYQGKVVRGYHCPPVQQPYWNTVYLDDFPEDELYNMIDHAYETVLRSFSKKVQRRILEEEKMQKE